MPEPEGIVGEYLALKRGTDADLLAMQMGDFYEFFGEDAETVGEELDLKVSEKSSGGTAYKMAGVPVDEVTPYLRALVERGYRVAVADQYETADGHDREVVRVVSPGTLLETEADDARYLTAIVRANGDFGLAHADVTTGRFHVTTVESLEAVLTECYRYNPVELLVGPAFREDDSAIQSIREATGATVTEHEANAFAEGAARHAVREQFGAGTIESLDLAVPTVRAAGGLLSYVTETGVGVEASMTRLSPYRADDHVTLDATTQRNLELTEPMGRGSRSLIDTIDRTQSAAGGRRLRAWIGRPIRDADELRRRQACIEGLTEAALAREAIREALNGASDLERLASKAVHGSANARDLLRLRETLAVIPELDEHIAGSNELRETPLPSVLERIDRERLSALGEELETAIPDDPATTLTEGGIIRPEYDEELADIVDQFDEAMGWVNSLAEREKQRLGVTHLQVDRNRTDGYYIQVGKSEADQVPDEYREIKTLKHSKRFTTDPLQQREREILRLEERRADLEYELFSDLRERVAAAAEAIQDAGRALAEIDVFAGLATHAVSNGWSRPALGGDGIEIERGRHPVVEQTTEFVPNDVRLSPDRRFLIVTGPNMSGKSTYMRQIALIVLLAQIGSYVPADRARIDPVDGVFTRVGALDELAQGRSTFMVEMQELSNILHSASDDSLVILDEVGRGTATYDGISIAWAATEYLHNEIGAYTLFATHYHELTALADHLDRVANVHVAADENEGEVTFLRTVKEGATDRSYGIHVADLAGVPAPVVDRARTVLDRLREEKAIEARGDGAEGTQQVVFDLEGGRMQTVDGGQAPDDPVDPDERAVLDELRSVDLSRMTPAELLTRLEDWQDRVD